MNTEQRDTPKRFVDYNVYPPSATSDRTGWAVTIGGKYIDGVRFQTRNDAEAYAQTEVLKQASHLSQSDSDTAYPNQTEVEAYWKSKQGRCLACNAEIAVQDQYCPSCHEFLLEVHTQTPN